MTFFSYGFRPFFLSAGLYACITVVAWISHLSGWFDLPAGIAPSQWHAHEMVFGYAGAAMAGFFLTAAPNWSGRPPLKGIGLALLFAVWVSGRLVFWFPGHLPPFWIAVVDIAFIPVLALTVLRALIGNLARQGVFFIVFGVLTGANIMFHADALNWNGGDPRVALILALDGFLIIMTVIGGRVVPSFTANYLRAHAPGLQQRSSAMLERSVMLLTAAVIILDISDATIWMGVVAIAAAVAHAIRLIGWNGHATFGSPIVWVLHFGYAWIPISLLLRGLAGVGITASAEASLHALGIGAVGTLTLAVMSRAALGHTGRPLQASAGTVGAYCLVISAAVIRIATALIESIPIAWGYSLSAVAWAAGFALFSWIYFPILTQPRVD